MKPQKINIHPRISFNVCVFVLFNFDAIVKFSWLSISFSELEHKSNWNWIVMVMAQMDHVFWLRILMFLYQRSRSRGCFGCYKLNIHNIYQFDFYHLTLFMKNILCFEFFGVRSNIRNNMDWGIWMKPCVEMAIEIKKKRSYWHCELESGYRVDITKSVLYQYKQYFAIIRNERKKGQQRQRCDESNESKEMELLRWFSRSTLDK